MKILILIAVLLFSGKVYSADLTWVDNSENESGFIIEMLSTGKWVEVARVGAGVTTYKDTNVEGIYRVKAYTVTPDKTELVSTPSNQAGILLAPINLVVK